MPPKAIAAALLAAAGIDLLPDFLAQRNAATGPVFCKTDSHWSGIGLQIAADRIAAMRPTLPAKRSSSGALPSANSLKRPAGASCR